MGPKIFIIHPVKRLKRFKLWALCILEPMIGERQVVDESILVAALLLQWWITDISRHHCFRKSVWDLNITIRESQTHRCTDAWTHAQTDTHTPTQTHRHRHALIGKTHKETHRHTQTHIDTHAHTNKHIDTQPNIYTNAQMHSVMLVHLRMHRAHTSQSHCTCTVDTCALSCRLEV